jgi:predicted metal-dependent hydrolase
MNTNQNKISVHGIEVETVKKDIKNIHVGVYPPNGRVRVAAPIKTTDETIKQIVLTKMSWIKKQQQRFKEQARQTKREYISGESHYFMGNRYRLNVIKTEVKPHIEIKRKTRIDMYVKPQATVEKKEKLFEEFYRQELKKQIPNLLIKWEKRTGLKVKEVKIKKMKTKWGTCNQKHQRIWLNLELAKNPQRCIEYVVVHEMTHLIEKNHTEKFKAKLKEYLPNWMHTKVELNSAPLSYSKWCNLTE